MAIAFALALAGMVGIVEGRVRAAASAYGIYAFGMSQREVRYRFGAPLAVAGNPQRWSYQDQGARLQLQFDSAGQLTKVACAHDVSRDKACPLVLGIGIGSSEREVALQFGPPSSERFAGTEKFQHFAALGLNLRLREAKVSEITQQSSETSLTSRLKLAAWQLMP